MRACEECGAAFEPRAWRGTPQRFCSELHRRRHKNRMEKRRLRAANRKERELHWSSYREVPMVPYPTAAEVRAHRQRVS